MRTGFFLSGSEPVSKLYYRILGHRPTEPCLEEALPGTGSLHFGELLGKRLQLGKHLQRGT